MKEAIAIFQEGFKLGLVPDLTLGTQAEYLTQCYNMVPGAFGIEARKTIEVPAVEIYGQKFPWPILFCLSKYNLIFTEDALFLADQSWGLTHLGSAQWGSIPHIADFIDTVIFSTANGQWMLTPAGLTQNLGGASFKTCCNFRGQLIVGNCELPKGPSQNSCVGPTSYDISVGGPNYVAWSKIGQLDWEYSLGNEVGWAPMMWQGKILALRPLLKEIVVYGTNGIAKLSPQKDPVTTYGVQDFGDIGLLSDRCVDGDYTHHLFLGNDYNLYLVEPERALSQEGREPKRLGYSHLMRSLVDPIITFDPAYSQWWIGDANKCYVFTGRALGEVSETPSHLNRLDGRLWGFSQAHGGPKAIIETGPITFNSKGIKTLMAVEVDAELLGTQVLLGQASWKSSYQKDFRRGKKIRLDPRGAFFPILAGTEFKLLVESPRYEDFQLSKLWLHYKTTDKTFSRGVVNAGSPAEQRGE